MTYSTNFSGWSDLKIEDLLVAYRKAKADCFFENTFPTAIKFAEYESDLLDNLEKLLVDIKDQQGFFKIQGLLGDIRLLPKKLSITPQKNYSGGHAHFSSSKRAFDDIVKNNTLVPEFRIVGDFPVNAHIISALWINMVGHKFDNCLDDSCYGARLKRISDETTLDKNADKLFHVSSIGSFTPYFKPYQQWRSDGLNAIRGELEQSRDVVAVSLDLKSYYHSIDPKVISNPVLHDELGVNLSTEEVAFTEELAKFLGKWDFKARRYSRKFTEDKVEVQGGLVIGLTASRIISNVLLHYWDRLIKEKIAPIHYGRYVDDMFLVMHDTGNIASSNDFMHFLQERLGEKHIYEDAGSVNSRSASLWHIQQGKKLQGKTVIQLQADKQKLFVLQGQSGLDLLDSIEKEIYELSSEHRLMPSPDQLDDSTAARVLSAAGSVGDEADTLRRADGLTIRRLSWSLRLRDVEILAKDLPPHEWIDQRKEFYQFAHNHILRPDNLFAHFTYLPRLLGFAIGMNEWQQAEQIAVASYESLKTLQNEVPSGSDVAINGVPVKANENLWRFVKGTLTWLFIDAATRYYAPEKLLSNKRSAKEKRLDELFLNGIWEELSDVNDILDFKFGSEEFHQKAPLVALADLAKEPYKNILKSSTASSLLDKRDGSRENRILKLFALSELTDTEVLKSFLNKTIRTRLAAVDVGKRKGESRLPYLFPTRALTPAEIAEIAPECVGLRAADGKHCEEKPSVIWAKYTQALRGTWVKPTLLAAEQEEGKSSRGRPYIGIGTDNKREIIVALTSLKTDDNDWAAMVCDKSNLSKDRYKRISDLVNQTLKLKPRPDYLLFPELSLPLPWVNSVAVRLAAAGISLIAGTEYKHDQKNNAVVSQVCLVLSDNRLGFASSVKIWQPKLEPAVGEDKNLISTYGKKWASFKSYEKVKPIYIHNGVHFGVMVCSELQNSRARINFQGKVDSLMVLSWNSDLDTFASLIESAALDVHAYTILVNNRTYGDSRIRSPAKISYKRDIARVRGGDNDFVIAAKLDIDSLRGFQSRSKRWPQENDKFKPLPEGYKLRASRRKSPPD